MTPEPGFEHSQLRGITIKNMLVTIVCTASIVTTVLTTLFSLKSDIKDIRDNQSTYNKITDLRLKALEDRQNIFEVQIQQLQQTRQK